MTAPLWLLALCLASPASAVYLRGYDALHDKGRLDALFDGFWDQDYDDVEPLPPPKAVETPAPGPGEDGGLLRRVRPAALRRLIGHSSVVSDAVFDPAGTRVLTASWDGTARLWDSGTGAELRSVRHGEGGRGQAIETAAFSRDGGRFVTAGADGAAYVWSADPSQAPVVLRGHSKAIEAAGWSADGLRLFTASKDQTVRLWDAADGRELRALPHPQRARAAAFSPDGARLLTGCDDGSARLWDVETGALLRTLPGAPGAAVRAVAFGPDGARAAVADTDARVWDLASGREERSWSFRGYQVESLAFHPKGRKLLLATSDGTVTVRELATGKVSAELRVGRGLYSAAYSPDGSRVVVSLGAEGAEVWKVDHSPEELEVIRRAMEAEVKPLPEPGAPSAPPPTRPLARDRFRRRPGG
ncbi:MAG: WD40 repeat domain-containing protein [Elusimicrobia bacterium]|nr:WD40 repeat domain-containing protein [Elusimicrobiota bacterium]